MATIISFANQKGGVGKTTLCTTFANYLSQRNFSVLVIDCDSQQSIYEKRKADEAKYKDYENFRLPISPKNLTSGITFLAGKPLQSIKTGMMLF